MHVHDLQHVNFPSTSVQQSAILSWETVHRLAQSCLLLSCPSWALHPYASLSCPFLQSTYFPVLPVNLVEYVDKPGSFLFGVVGDIDHELPGGVRCCLRMRTCWCWLGLQALEGAPCEVLPAHSHVLVLAWRCTVRMHRVGGTWD